MEIVSIYPSFTFDNDMYQASTCTKCCQFYSFNLCSLESSAIILNSSASANSSTPVLYFKVCLVHTAIILLPFYLQHINSLLPDFAFCATEV